MENFIIISGFQLWIVLIITLITLFGVIALGRGYLAEVHKNERLRRRLQAARVETAEWHHKYMMASYNVPNAGGVDDDE